MDTTGSGLSTGTYSFTNSGSAATVYAYYEVAATNYTGITAVAKGTANGTSYSVNLGTIQSSTTVNSSTGLAVSAGSQSGYTFYKWVASGSGTFANANSASTTFYPAANSEVATAQYKKNYTFSNGTTDTHGTVTVPSGTKLAGDAYSGTVTPSDGYKIKTLTVGGNAVSAAVGKTTAYTYSGTTGSSATGTTTPISVVATFEPITDLNLYIAGRFHVRQSSGSTTWINSFDSGDWSNTGDENIQFTYDSGTTYKVETYASVGELSTQISGYDPYFFVYDATNSKGWHPVSGVNLNGTTTSASLTTNTSTNNVRFNDSTNTDAPVTLYFNVATKELSYDVPNYYTVTCDTATGGTVTADVAKQKEGETVTLTLAPATGYTINTVTVTKAGGGTVAVSGTGSTRTFTMPASAVTVSATFTETTHTVYVRKRYYQNNGTTLISTETTNTQTLTDVGIATAKQVNAAPTVTDYTFYKFTLPSGVTLKSGSLTTSAAITVNATVDNAVIYIDYKETVYNITVATNSTTQGTVLRGTTTVSGSTTTIGNVTAVTLAATNKSGYEFDHWTVTKGTATTMVVNGTIVSLSGTSEQTISSANASASFKFNGTATLKAYFKATAFSLNAVFTHNNTAAWNGNTVTTTDTNGNTKSSLNINDYFEVKVTLAAGYAVSANPTFESGTGFVSATLQSGYPKTSGSVVTYRYQATTAGKITAKVTLKAATPTISNVQIKNTSFNFAAYGNPTVNYYLQPTEVKATTDSFATLGYNNTRENQTGTSGTAVTLTQPSINLNAEDATATYVLTITATNAPSGVTAATETATYTIRVQFNDAQKAYFKVAKMLEVCVKEDANGNVYYSEDAPIAAYNTAWDAAKALRDGGYPAYNANATVTANAQTVFNNFNTAFNSLMISAKTTKVYVLTQYANSTTNPINMTFTTNGTTKDWQHTQMYNLYTGTIADGVQSRHMTYGGNVTYSGTKYFYTIVYGGHAKIQIWHGTSASGATVTGELTGVITGATAFKEYYVNAATVSAGNGTGTAVSEYVDFEHTISPGKKYLEISDEPADAQTGAQIKTLFGITPVSSMITAPGISVENTSFTIEGPGITGTLNLLQHTFQPSRQGKYTVKYTTRFGYDANGAAITRTKEMTLYVAYDDVTIYVDMNDNVGNPILNFQYWQINEVPVAAGTAGATAAYLPYEMELVTGSESIYKYTIKTSKLHKDYLLQFDANHPLNISYITVERNKIGENSGGFDIINDARITGEIWFKADSSHLTTFQTISCGSVANSFIAVTDGGTHTVLNGAFDALHGTGIITDENEIYKAQYAALYTPDGASAPMNNFHYVVNISAKREVQADNNTYYFYKWIACPTSGVSYNDTHTAATYTNGADTGDPDTTALNFTAAPAYADGTGDKTYIALYKPAQSGDSNVRVEVTYQFKDYDTSDGNYVFDRTEDENGRIAKTVDASYTKTVLLSGTSFNAVKSTIASIAETHAPYIKSNYFDYSFVAGSAQIVSELPNESKLIVKAELLETPHTYTIILKNGSTVVDTPTGYYQETAELSSAGLSNPVWKIASGNTDVVLGSGATGSTFTARFAAVNDGDTQVIKVTSGSATAADHTSVVSDAYTEVYYTDSGTEMLRHNFYIIDYCAEGTLTGGGVLFATTDQNGTYRQANAATVLASTATRQNFITGILGSDFETEYKAQTINNVGFRYKPFKSTEDVYRYSDNLKAYTTIYEGTNVNSSSYDNQKLRLFSFMVYNNNGTKVIVPSDGYAEVDRYQPQT